MSNSEQLIDLVHGAGPAAEGVDQITHIIASLPAGSLTRAAKAVTPKYADIEYDLDNGGEVSRHMDENPTPAIALGTDILLRQQELSKTSRRLAVIACSLVLFVGAGLTRNQSIDDYNHGLPRQEQTDNTQRLESDALISFISGAFGGFTAYFTSLGFSNRLARRPAQRIVRRAVESSTK